TIKPQGLGIALVGNELFANYIEEVNVQLTDCDILLLITDGVNEIRNSSGEEFDFQRISDFLASHNSSAQKLLNQFLQNINDFKGDAPQIDDLTIFVVSFSSNKNKRSINE
ncbi:MAG TPA: SpoIIE family protein phosphatase, partial [Candidatus Kapabacteria bacterium]|nr:SpoIIE family protein phosphatase [Candidatus Kapabacteria bacterium]